MDPAGGVERFHGVERLVDEKAPLVGIKRAGPDQLAERPAFEQFKNLIGAVVWIGSRGEEPDPAVVEDGRLAGCGVGAGSKGQSHGDLVFRGGIARAKDAGFAAGTDGGEQQVTSIDKRAFHEGTPARGGNQANG